MESEVGLELELLLQFLPGLGLGSECLSEPCEPGIRLNLRPVLGLGLDPSLRLSGLPEPE